MGVLIENRKRSVWHLPVVEAQQPRGEEGPTVRVETARLVLGDAADRAKVPDGKIRRPGVDLSQQERRQPSPVVRMTASEYKSLGARNHALLDRLVETGEITRLGA